MGKISILIIIDDTSNCWNFEIVDKLFGNFADIKYIDIKNLDVNIAIDSYDLIIALNNKIFEEIKDKLQSYDNVVIIEPTFNQEVYQWLLDIKHVDTKLICENNEYSNSVKQLVNIIIPPNEIRNNINVENGTHNGITSIYYNTIDEEKEIKNVKLYISFKTIVEIILKANLFFLIDELTLLNYLEQIYNSDEILENLYNVAKTVKIRLYSITTFMRRSLIEIDRNLNIITINNVVEKLLKTQRKDIINTCFDKWFPSFEIEKIMKKGVLLKDKMVSFEGNNYFLSVHMVVNEKKEIIGANVVIEGLEDVEDIYKTLRGHMFKQGYIAKYTIDNIIGKSNSTENLKNIIRSMALSDSSVLITGETGTGKEIVAQALHNLSSRKDKPFVAINCVALPESLLESELFGYEEGAFTGAKKGGKQGVFELAYGGTVFLDEIGKMPISLQGKLLRVIQEREIMRLGGSKIISIDIRLIAATNKNIKNLIEENLFINDLYYRINVLPIYILPLRDRKEDIEVIIKYYTQANGYRFSLSNTAMQKILKYKWPGNVREVINCLEYFDNLRKEIICDQDLPVYILSEDNYNKNIKKDDADIDISVLFNYINDEVMISLCEILLNAYENFIRIGRCKIVKEITKKGIFITEQRIRKYIDFLRNSKIIIVHNKGGGTQLTAEGKDIVINWLNRLNK